MKARHSPGSKDVGWELFSCFIISARLERLKEPGDFFLAHIKQITVIVETLSLDCLHLRLSHMESNGGTGEPILELSLVQEGWDDTSAPRGCEE